jgi:hypothetical protein
MAQASTILNADRGRVLVAAVGVLCLLMTVQILLVGGALLRKPALAGAEAASEGGAAAAVAAAPDALIPPAVTLRPPAIGELAPSPAAAAAPAPVSAYPSFGPPPIGSFDLPGGLNAGPPPAAIPGGVPAPGTLAGTPAAPPVPAPLSAREPMPARPASAPPALPRPDASAASSADPAASMTLPELVDLAKQVRALGDMQGALEVLRRADLRFPANPEVLAEMAACYEQMGLTDKAAIAWRQLSGMDAAKAGSFKELAARRLSAPAPDAAAFAADAPKGLSLGACRAVRDANAVNGEKVLLRIPVLRNGNAQVDPGQVDIDVFFFDRVNGERIAQTIADEPASTWSAPPVDWSGIGEEPLDVTYFLPALTPGEIAAHGRRAYHGYVVRLYYQNKLQDVAAEPRDLLDFGISTPQRSAEDDAVHPLLPPVAN